MTRSLRLYFGLVLLSGTAGFAGEEAEETFTDKQHRGLSRFVIRQAERLNERLADVVLDEEERETQLYRQFYGDRDSAYHALGSYIEIAPRLDWSERDGVRADVDFSARLRLRGLSDRFRFFLDSQDSDQELIDELFVDRYRSASQRELRQDTSAGLIYQISDRVSRRVSVSGGLRFRPSPTPRLRTDARFFTDLGSWRAEFGQRLFWDMEDGFGERSQLQFTRPFADAHTLRLTSSAVWSETSQGVDLAHIISWKTDFSPQRFVFLRAGVLGYSEPQVESDQYFARVVYRQRASRDWLFIELETGLDFYREDDFEASPVAGIKLICLFGSY
ncbi:MAG: hypothetical protein JJU05_00905 [Verrucomicrobia bacterium]|nr:hypothetical protein [Verrucomicrobiota bacterium]MCH8525957.1 hypothetical protein [Kiritimatiellia bacterium]